MHSPWIISSLVYRLLDNGYRRQDHHSQCRPTGALPGAVLEVRSGVRGGYAVARCTSLTYWAELSWWVDACMARIAILTSSSHHTHHLIILIISSYLSSSHHTHHTYHHLIILFIISSYSSSSHHTHHHLIILFIISSYSSSHHTHHHLIILFIIPFQE